MTFGSFPIGGAPIGGQIGDVSEFDTPNLGYLVSVPGLRTQPIIVATRDMTFLVPIRETATTVGTR